MKKVAGGSTTIYHYDLQGNLIEETDGSGNLIADYVYAGTNRIAMIKPGNTVYYYHNDHLGTPLAMTNQAGQVVWSASYLPFGEAVITTATETTITNNFRFPGQYYDAETGLHYNYHRYYDPSTGRYLTPDPIGLRGGINLFAYVANDPVNSKDITGLIKIYGQWCGANWTGGNKEPYTPHPPGYYLDPQDDLDGACKTHDICYYQCRQQNPCNGAIRSQCFRECDRVLTNSAYEIGGFWGNIIGAAVDRPGIRDPEANDCSCRK